LILSLCFHLSFLFLFPYVVLGAGQLRNIYNDEPFDRNHYNVALYSSLGPTYDGRYKPDIIAPGDSVMSTYSGDPSVLLDAINMKEKDFLNKYSNQKQQYETCAVYQNTGTSMSTPFVSGSAILIRQYFMEATCFCDNSNYLFYHFLIKQQQVNDKQSAFQKKQPRETTNEKESHLLFQNRQNNEGSRIGNKAFEDYIYQAHCTFIPSGYFLKGIILHSGNHISTYSDPAFNNELDAFISMGLTKQPDYFQGYGSIKLSNILSNAIYLKNWKEVLKQRKKLYFWDKLEIPEHSTLEVIINMTSFTQFLQEKHSSLLYPSVSEDEKLEENDPFGGQSIPPLTSRSFPLKVTICWYDPPIPFSFISKLLVHNLDLYVRLPKVQPVSDSPASSTSSSSPPTDINNGLNNHQYYLGNKRDGVYSQNDIETEYVIADDRNPNEQVIIDNSLCYDIKNSDCLYKIFISSHLLPMEVKQKFSLFISTYGKLLILFSRILSS
jgi:hypothetical protein